MMPRGTLIVVRSVAIADSVRACRAARSVRARLTRQRAGPLAHAGGAEPPGDSPVQMVEGHTDSTCNFTARRAAGSSAPLLRRAGCGHAWCVECVGGLDVNIEARRAITYR